MIDYEQDKFAIILKINKSQIKSILQLIRR